MAITKDDSICNDCHWFDQCGEDNMQDCSDHDSISQDAEDRYINSYIEKCRMDYYREYQDYLDYIERDKWSDKYDM